MAVARTLNVNGTGGGGASDSNAVSIMMSDLVEPPTRILPVPNHLLDTRVFTKVGQNAVVGAKPSSIHFAGFDVDKIQKHSLRLTNVSTECQRWHIIPPNTSYFKIHYTKQERLVPGLSMDVSVEFEPDEWRYYYDCIRIHAKGEENLLIPIHAYPIMTTDTFPDNIRFPPTPLGLTNQHVIPLRCQAPIDFEYQLTFLQTNPAFTVHPMSGLIPANGCVDIVVSFTPSEYITARIRLMLQISQFNATPLYCSITGHSEPGLAKQLTELKLDREFSQRNGHLTTDVSTSLNATVPDSSLAFEPGVGREGEPVRRELSVLDPTSQSPVAIARRKKRAKQKQRSNSCSKMEVELNGYRFLANINSPYAVSYVLNQQAGKLRAKELREAMLVKKEKEPTSRQMKEALFEHTVKQDVMEERANQLRWQVHLGQDAMLQSTRVEITVARDYAWKDYKIMRGDPIVENEYSRLETSCIKRRTRRELGVQPTVVANFDPLKNDPWSLRHRALGRFVQAARKIILRLRVDRRLPLIQTLRNEIKAGLFERQLSAGYAQMKEEVEQEVDKNFTISPDKIARFTFPVYEEPGKKDDMAPDALGVVPVKFTDIVVKKKVPYFKLKVPQQYVLMSYQKHSVHSAGRGYVPVKLDRPLRSGAEDELIKLPTVSKAWQEPLNENMSLEQSTSVQLIPASNELKQPPGMVNPTEYHELHIFNPAPGLQLHLQPMPYSEIDPDYHLCPAPRYVRTDDNPYGSTQKHYLDSEDVIRGLMVWKKFPSHGLVTLSNTPTLSTVWVPRWSDPFTSDLLPADTPPLLTSLPDADRAIIDCTDSNGVEEDLDPEDQLDGAVALSPEMIKAEFPLIDETNLLPTDNKKTITMETLISDMTKQSTNHTIAPIGYTPRESREVALESHLCQRNNKLGAKLNERIDKLNNICTNPNLTLN